MYRIIEILCSFSKTLAVILFYFIYIGRKFYLGKRRECGKGRETREREERERERKIESKRQRQRETCLPPQRNGGKRP